MKSDGKDRRADGPRTTRWACSRGAVLAGLAVALALQGCASSTTMTHSWTTPDLRPGSVKKVFVVGVAQNQGLRHLYEDTFVSDLKSGKLEAEAGYTRIADQAKVDREAVAASLRQDGFTNVLVTRVVNVEDRETYVPPTTVTVGVGYGGYPGYYGGWYPYMSAGYGYVTSPGYITSSKIVSLETNLYDLANEKLVYSGMTETWVGDAPESDIRQIIDKVIWDMRAKKVL